MIRALLACSSSAFRISLVKAQPPRLLRLQRQSTITIPDPPITKFTKWHVWARLEDDEGWPICTIGLTPYALKILKGKIVQVILPGGSKISWGDTKGGRIDSKWKEFEVMAPITGGIVNVNVELLSDFTPLENAPMDKVNSWFMKVQLYEECFHEWQELLTEEQYRAYCEDLDEKERSRVKTESEIEDALEIEEWNKEEEERLKEKEKKKRLRKSPTSKNQTPV